MRAGYATARAWSIELLMAVDVPRPDAELVAEQLVRSDLRGVTSHGLMRLPTYVERVRLGLINPRPHPSIAEDAGGLVLVDGDGGLGQVVGTFAMRLAIDRAREHGTSWVSVRRSNHYGACAHYALMAAAEGMIGISATVGAKNIMAPWGGAEPLLGNNPFGIAVPAGRHPPVVLDMALSVAAGGKIQLAAKEGRSIPADWAFDPQGRPTTDARVAWERLMVRPVGEYKGYGMAFMVAVLAALVPAAAVGGAVGDLHGDFVTTQDVGHFMQAIDVGRLVGADDFRSRVDQLIDLMHGSPLAEGFDEVLVPGEREDRVETLQLRDGISYPAPIAEDLSAIGTALGVGPFPGEPATGDDGTSR
jgi:LDH2 family malate/lactate/ureidoglycolate dehydrogenase